MFSSLAPSGERGLREPRFPLEPGFQLRKKSCGRNEAERTRARAFFICIIRARRRGAPVVLRSDLWSPEVTLHVGAAHAGGTEVKRWPLEPRKRGEGEVGKSKAVFSKGGAAASKKKDLLLSFPRLPFGPSHGADRDGAPACHGGGHARRLGEGALHCFEERGSEAARGEDGIQAERKREEEL